ncbi:MAG: polysaccharide biosynthesis C-terminal domain-containing protein [Ruminococcus sp.]
MLFLRSLLYILFLYFRKITGKFSFHSETARIYIRTLAFICPFLYTNTALESILNGLGRPDTCLFHNIAGVCIRIGFVFFSIPVLGIRGYFYGMLLSQLILTLLHFIYLNRLERV